MLNTLCRRIIPILLLPLAVGCATYTAVKIPGPVDDEKIAIGEHRSQVEVILRAPIVNEYHDADGTTARYQYKDGPHQASKGRVVLYIAGDVFTAFLSELIFWPIEAYASKQTERVATAQYDNENVLTGFAVDRPGGERLMTLGTPLPGPPPTEFDASTKSSESPPVTKSRKGAR